MCRLNLNFLLFLFFLVTVCKAQEKKTVYLIFKENEQVNCVKYNSNNNNRQDRSTSTYTGVMKKSENSNKEIVFSMCREKLFLVKDTNPEKISTTDVNELDLVKFDYLIEEYIKSDMFSKRYVFDKIYFIEKINEKEYLKYEVYWEHYVHRGIQN